LDQPQNPYTPPKADIAATPVAGTGAKIPVFSPTQGAVGTFVGGPLAGTYLLRTNYLAKGDRRNAMKVTLWGIALTLALLVALPYIPDSLPTPVIPISYAVAVRVIIEKMQFTKAQIASSTTFSFHAPGRVALVALLGMLIFFGALISAILLLPGYSGGES
jgi:hypothetical protein